MPGSPALRRCICVDPAEFASTYWSQRPLLSTGEQLGGDFGDLFSLDAADELLSRRGLRTPFIRVAKDGQIVDSSRYTRPGGVGAMVADQVADDRILELFLDGHTVVLQGLHRLWPPLIELGGDLRATLGHPVQINAYITPGSSTGFSAHYDVHDVFVLQVAGEKRWRISEPVLRDPLRDQPWTQRKDVVAARAGEPPCIDAVLRPGDALYLPRGYLHAAEALGDVSVHLTVGVHPVTRYTLVEALLGLAADEPALRTSLPLGVDVADPAQLDGELAATVEALVTRLRAVTADELAARLLPRLSKGGRGGPLGPLAQAAAWSSLSPETVVVRRRHLPGSVQVDGDDIVLTAGDRQLRLPGSTAAAVRQVWSGAVLRVGDLPGLEGTEAVVLARRLVREGIVVVVPDSDAVPSGEDG